MKKDERGGMDKELELIRKAVNDAYDIGFADGKASAKRGIERGKMNYQRGVADERKRCVEICTTLKMTYGLKSMRQNKRRIETLRYVIEAIERDEKEGK